LTALSLQQPGQVVSINVVVNALLVFLLAYTTIKTVRVRTTVQFQVAKQ